MSINAEKFWARVDKQPTKKGCWLWTLSKGRGGHGQFTENGKHYESHRAAYELSKGPIPEGCQIRHTCDVGACCNPAHLIPGSHAENMQDRTDRNRAAKGERNGARLHPENLPRGACHGNAKITEQVVREIRSRYAEGNENQTQIALAFGVGQTQVSNIIRGKVWKHVI